ncbi:MAG TPA: NrfD/PsrC family molybdoenzyme membrane anchor subunit [Vicinamibacterales bacterium]|nr:NrfD/PsrC family molybdoenzyme membrane anchor subunit [Vicinamibacterales bacterium]
MIDAPSSTWFTTNPHWQWYIVLYFFIGGLAGGCYFLAALIDHLGRVEDRPLARLGYYVAFPAVLLSGLLLTLDLSRPLRFWHMLIERNTFEPMFKAWSPMSIGSWALLAFGLFSFISFMGALAEEDRLRWPAFRRLQWPAFRTTRPPAVTGLIVAVLGGLAGLFVAGYTGVLLAVTNRPIWSDTPLLGMLFIVSAASTSTALLMLLAQRYGWRALPGVAALQRMDGLVLALELLVLAAVVVSLGSALRGWLNAWGALLLFGVIIPGLIVPLVLSWRQRRFTEASIATMAALVLIGGFLLRVVVIFSSETI